MKVLNFGSLNLDYVYQVEHFVEPGETLSASAQTVLPGGKGLNQSIALAKSGAEVYHAGLVGNGGAMLRRLLEDSGVHTEYLGETDALQGNAVIQLTPSGENGILLFGGSNQCITQAQVDSTLAAFGKGDYLVLQNEINRLPELVNCAFERGMHIVLNPSPFNEKLKDVDFGKLSWLLINEVEAEQLSGSREPEIVWRRIGEDYPNLSVVITLGKDGCVVYHHSETIRQKAFPVQAVDTTAAGDTFTGFFIGSLLRGEPLADCVKWASAAAAISVTRMGAAASIPTMDEVRARLDS